MIIKGADDRRGRPSEHPQFPGEALWVMTLLPVKRPDIAQLPVAYARTQGNPFR